MSKAIYHAPGGDVEAKVIKSAQGLVDIETASGAKILGVPVIATGRVIGSATVILGVPVIATGRVIGSATVAKKAKDDDEAEAKAKAEAEAAKNQPGK